MSKRNRQLLVGLGLAVVFFLAAIVLYQNKDSFIQNVSAGLATAAITLFGLAIWRAATGIDI